MDAQHVRRSKCAGGKSGENWVAGRTTPPRRRPPGGLPPASAGRPRSVCRGPRAAPRRARPGLR